MMDTAAWYQMPRHIERVPQKDYGRAMAVYYDSVPYQGRDTKVFAYLAMPDGDAPVPGVVLLHGGGGTAFPQWAQMWANRGYAALALDMEGLEPVVPGGYERTGHASAGPCMVESFGDSALPVQAQWMYHALAAASRGLSWLRSNPRVRRDAVGLVGISWGSIAAGILVTLDRRFRFCVPIYGCGCLPQDPAFGAVFANNPAAKALWDPSGLFGTVRTSMLLINGLEDAHFSPLSTLRSQLLFPNARMSLLPGFLHGHEHAWAVEEAHAFADACCKRRVQPLPGVSIARAGSSLRITPPGAAHVRLIYSPTGIRYGAQGQCESEWVAGDALPGDKGVLYIPYPQNSRFLFVNCETNTGVNISSNVLTDHQI